MKQWIFATTLLGFAFLTACQSQPKVQPPEVAEPAGPAPVTILQAHKWVVDDIDQKGIVDKSRATLVFSEDGRVAGRASCNRLHGSYSAEQNQLSFGNVATTLMMCPEAIMNQEQRFLAALEKVDRFDISEHGALVLYSGEKILVEAFPDE